MKRWSLLGFFFAVALPPVAYAIDVPGFEALDWGGRFQYAMMIDRETEPFPWDATDRGRLMLDLYTGRTAFGGLYLKAAASWQDVSQGSKRFRFEQGDYYWALGAVADTLAGSSSLRVRLFANERRFFVSDRIAPLVTDDILGESGDNRGIRVDAAKGGLEFSAIYALLGDRSEYPRVGYARTGFSGVLGTLSASYRIDDLQAWSSRNRSAFKAEYAAAYRRAYAVIAYEQTGFDDRDLFFPSGRGEWGRLDGFNVSHVLPDAGALFAELRVAPIRTGSFGSLKVVYRYDAAGSGFVTDSPLVAVSAIRHTAYALFRATQYNLNGRLLFRRADRYGFETEERDIADLHLFGVLANGLELLSRGRYERVDGGSPFDADRNFLHLGLTRRESMVRAGAHVMWKDIDTDFTQTRFAFDGKLALTPDVGFHWRFIFGNEVAGTESIFARIEYRPSNRIFATFDYGYASVGDGPYMVEDPDIGAPDISSAVYTVSLRGDF